VTKWKTAIVVGASSGIGEAIARRLAAEGTRVALLARRGDELQRVADDLGSERALVRTHDVIDGHDVPALWDEIEAAIGEVDLLVYASGLVIPVDEHEYTYEKDERMVAVNLVGAMAWLDQAAVRMEVRRGGTIIGISSIAGGRGRRGAPAYNAAKAGMTTFLEALRNRLSRYGVNVVTIRPGFVDTAMTRGMEGLLWLISADRAAELTLEHARAGSSRDRHVPGRWLLVSLVIRFLPSWLFRRTSI
jgi:NAD(P)-dependent dehydrogenase (short-subunit alcohol dehydrogenase family)